MDSNQTLHDFVLNLITNAEARSAFQLDPEGTLNQAGLGDITAGDVQDVVPLVVDYASVQGPAGLTPAVPDPDLGTLGSDPLDAVQQLQLVTQQLAVAQPPGLDGNVAAASTIAVDAGTLGVAADGFGGIGVSAGPGGVSAGLSGENDVAATLDSAAVDAVDAVEPVTGGVTGSVGGAADGAVGSALDGGLGGLLGDGGPLGSGLVPELPDPAGVVDGVTDGHAPVSVPELELDEGAPAVGGVTGPVDETLDSVGGGLLEGDAGARSSADAEAEAGAGGRAGGPLDDILF